ncbi:hypothetical protein [Salinarimonas ramus]|uniref:Uncharacterized protein n=1 Tax=Salinarimonas ramus TaxID=690164 RepID=A0A917Q604_9HYPH|nr:hypothetical protein [Salinarimonas ramus]GGK27690.1 hypothetical protein GCM10011322_12800 [Salinarimonas ramus]
MPHFDPHYADKLRGSHGLAQADTVLDLRGVARPAAEASLAELIERSRFGEAISVAVRIAAPIPGAGETLFQPVGRTLLEARRKGHVASLSPLPAQDGLGFFVRLAGRGAKEREA